MAALEEALASSGLDATTLRIFAAEGAEQIYYLKTSGEQALAQWRLLRQRVGETGYWPLILGDAAECENLRVAFNNTTRMPREVQQSESGEPDIAYSAAAIIAYISQFPDQDPPAGADRAAAEERSDEDGTDVVALAEIDDESNALGYDSDEDEEEDELDDDPPRGDWPAETERQTRVYATTNLSTGEYLPEVYLGFVPSPVSWHMPVYLRFSSPDYDMDAAEHAATLRHWERIFGAEVVAITGSGTIEMLVANPPQDRAAAIELALEQYSYCPDIVNQGSETIDALAAELRDNPFWYFWWD